MLHGNRKKLGSYALRSAGFTIIEILMVIALMGIIFTLVIPNFNIVPTTEASSKINGLAGDIRAAYDMAVLHRRAYRLVFEFKTADYWLETTERKNFQLDDQTDNRDPSPEEIKEKTAVFEEEMKEYEELAGKEFKDADTEQVIKPSSPLLAARDYLKPVVWKAVEDSEWSRRKLGPSFLLRSMQTEHHKILQTYEDLQQDGYAYLYFFPHGYVERAVLYVAPADEDDKTRWDQLTYTVTTRPWEGVAEVETGFKEVDVSRDAKPR
jgi:general secretion pathway protein H